MSEHIIETEISNGALFIPYQSKLSEAVREEIVRCADCMHFERTAKNGICHRSEFLPMWAEPNGFCAWAERKEGGDD